MLRGILILLTFKYRKTATKMRVFWLRMKGIPIGKHTVIGRYSNITGNVSIGVSCRLQEGVYIYATSPGHIIIGNGVTIGAHTFIVPTNRIYNKSGVSMNQQGETHEDVIIEDDVLIGGNSSILPGVTIGKGAYIGAGSVVTKDIPPYMLAYGNPARVVKNRFE